MDTPGIQRIRPFHLIMTPWPVSTFPLEVFSAIAYISGVSCRR